MNLNKFRYALIGVGVVLVGGLGWAGYSTYHYIQHDARFCTNCHIMDDAFKRWSSSEHSKITCHGCHAPDVAANLRQLYVYLTNPPERPTHRPELENSVCYKCHRVESDGHEPQADQKWKQVLAEAGHQEHVAKQKIQCVRCHSTSLHKFVPPSEICISCHRHETLQGSGMEQHCTTCHNYTATGRASLAPSRRECLECHEAMQVNHEVFPESVKGAAQKAVMHWDCGTCHKPHSKIRLEQEQCRECHADQLKSSDIHAVRAHRDCLSCHRPHLWKVTTQEPCLTCHTDKKAHADGEVCASCHE